MLDKALKFSSEKEFLLVGRLAQFSDSMGSLIAQCWYSPKNCEHDALKSLFQCSDAIKLLIKVVSLKSPFLVESGIHAFQSIVKAVSAFMESEAAARRPKGIEDEMSSFVNMLMPKLLDSLTYFASEQFAKKDYVKSLQGFESDGHQRSFVTKLINVSCSLLKGNDEN